MYNCTHVDSSFSSPSSPSHICSCQSVSQRVCGVKTTQIIRVSNVYLTRFSDDFERMSHFHRMLHWMSHYLFHIISCSECIEDIFCVRVCVCADCPLSRWWNCRKRPEFELERSIFDACAVHCTFWSIEMSECRWDIQIEFILRQRGKYSFNEWRGTNDSIRICAVFLDFCILFTCFSESML